MIEQLAVPVVVEGDFGPVTLTHRCWGFTHQPWSKPAMVSYAALGIVSSDGTFKPFPGKEQTAQFDDTDYARLIASNPNGKREGVFRTDDIIAIHREAVQKSLEEAAKRAAAEAANATIAGA